MPPPPPGCPEFTRIVPGTGLSSASAAASSSSSSSGSPIKPPLPTFPTRLSQQVKNIEVQLPPLVAGALVAAFSKALADGLNNELLAHYYLPDQKVQVNLDRVVDRLLVQFSMQLWNDLFHFYHDPNANANSNSNSSTNSEPSRQVTLLFDGPIRQLVLILNGPETARCILDKLAPGLSRRPLTWSTNTKGIDLPLALQLLCSYWHREFPAQSPGGSPDEIARTLHRLITTGNASRNLVSEIQRLLLSPHFVQMHVAESAIWDVVLRRPFRPPPDGFHVVQFKFECQLFGALDGIGDPQLIRIGSLPAVTGTASDCVCTTVSEYIDMQWPKCGRILLGCLEEALANAWISYRQGEGCSGMSVWDGSDGKGHFCPGLRLIHLEVEGSSIRMSVSAWVHTLIEVFQQMSWTCAALSSSPFPGQLSECAVEVSNWVYLNDSVYVDCSLNHHPVSVSRGDGLNRLRHLQGAVIANGFPLKGTSSHMRL